MLELQPSPFLDAQKMVRHPPGAGEVPRATHTPLFWCEQSERFAVTSPDSQPFSALHKIQTSTVGKQNLLWEIVRSWPND